MVEEGRRYRILGALGRGGFGTVYQAELTAGEGFSRYVALKALSQPDSQTPDVARRLRDEARLLAQVQHRAVVKVDQLVQLEGRWTIVMEWVDGADLRKALDRGPLPAGPALEIAAEVAHVLATAWSQLGRDGQPLRLMHRDIKPSNIMIAVDGNIKLLDFGTARANFDHREAYTTSIGYGTVDYMSPERLDFRDHAAADIYALGSVLYECLTGVRLGRTSANPSVHQQVLGRTLDRLNFEGLSPDLIQLIMSMLDYEPTKRPDAGVVSTCLRELRRQADGPWLSDWASMVIPGIRRPLSTSEDHWIGRTLAETSTLSRPIAHPTSDTHSVSITSGSKQRWGIWFAFGLSAFGSAAIVLVGGLALFATWLPPGSRAVASTTSMAAVPTDVRLHLVENLVQVPETKTENLVQVPRVDPTPLPNKVEKTTPMPKSDAAAVRPKSLKIILPTTPIDETTTAPAPQVAAKPSEFRVSVTGDAASVVLVSKGNRYSPGRLPPGTYDILANFGEGNEVHAGRIEIRSDMTLQCRSGFDRCSVVGGR